MRTYYNEPSSSVTATTTTTTITKTTTATTAVTTPSPIMKGAALLSSAEFPYTTIKQQQQQQYYSKQDERRRPQQKERKLWHKSCARLPLIVLEHIFRHLDPASLAACARVCRSWHSVAWSRIEVEDPTMCARITDSVLMTIVAHHKPRTLVLGACRNLTSAGLRNAMAKACGITRIRMRMPLASGPRANALAEAMVEATVGARGVRHVEIPGALRSPEHVKVLVNALSRSVLSIPWQQRLRSLDVRGVASRFAGCSAAVSGGGCGDDGASKLAGLLALPAGAALEYLGVMHCNVGAKGASTLLEAAAAHGHMRHLVLGGNPDIGKGGGIPATIVAIAAIAPALSHLNLSGCGLKGIKGISGLVAGLLTARQRHKGGYVGLTTLVLDDNALGDEGSAAIIEAMLGDNLHHQHMASHTTESGTSAHSHGGSDKANCNGVGRGGEGVDGRGGRTGACTIYLGLARCGAGKSAAAALARALENGGRASNIMLAGNYIAGGSGDGGGGDGGSHGDIQPAIRLLANALAAPTCTLGRLDLTRNGLNAAENAALREAAEAGAQVRQDSLTARLELGRGHQGWNWSPSRGRERWL